MSLDEQFEAAATRANSLSKRPDNTVLLKMYSLYKQAKMGDVQGKEPGMFNMAARAKWQAWSGLKGTDQDEAKQQYIALIDELSAD